MRISFLKKVASILAVFAFSVCFLNQSNFFVYSESCCEHSYVADDVVEKLIEPYTNHEKYGDIMRAISILRSDDEFCEICYNDLAKGEEILNSLIEHTLNKKVSECNDFAEKKRNQQAKAVAQGVYYVSRAIPAVNQIRSYYCGPAATIQALIGNGIIIFLL